ncbi:MAG: phosphorylase [Proteobacteria bacterium]|nr:MAG: phosphorylase [Pseudomonadota bacterium]
MIAPAPAPDLSIDAIDRRLAAACDSGALQPIRTEQTLISDHGLPFVVKWIARDALAGHRHKPARSPHHNPFLPPEETLTFGALGDTHLVLLNKYPVMPRHLLVVTRVFEAQTAAITEADFAALGTIVAAHGGLGFYNAGERAGASQDHKHLQWIPDLPPLARQLAARAPEDDANFRFRHAFAVLPAGLWSGNATGQALARCYHALCRQAGFDPQAAELPPYNLLVTRAWMWLIPRRAERWQHMSINALGFAGSLFVKSREQLPALTEAGPLALLEAVGEPV